MNAKGLRTEAQNRRYWALLTWIAASAPKNGSTQGKDEWHGFFAGLFLGWDEMPDGRQVPMSTSKLTVSEFTEYHDQVQTYAEQKLGLSLEAV